MIKVYFLFWVSVARALNIFLGLVGYWLSPS